MVNAEEIRATYRDIAADPSSWNQGNYAFSTPCGTTACFAGKTLIRHGYEIKWYAGFAWGWIDPQTNERVTTGPSMAAASILGLDDVQRFNLFCQFQGNTLEELAKAIREITGVDVTS